MTDLCPHFGDCGGCSTQDQPLAEQRAEKEDRVRRVLSPWLEGDFPSLISSPDSFFYRNKMEFCFGGLKDEPPLLGLRRRGRFDRVVDLSECRLLSPEIGALLKAVRGWALADGRPTYHLKSHRGFLRYLVVREGKNTGQRMICLVTAEGNSPGLGFQKAVEASGVRVDTAVWAVNSTLSDVAFGEEREILWGDGFIEEKLGDQRFRISPKTFFQTNTRGAEVLYGEIAGLLSDSPVAVLFDLYCGTGTIGLFLANKVQRVVGVELNPASVLDAQSNAAALGVSAEFIQADASVFAKDPSWSTVWALPGTVAVLDPPRPGLSGDVIRLLMEKPLERWVYVSCNPEALTRDLGALSAVYRLQSVRVVDLFPHTPHVETVVLLVKKG